MRKIKCFTLVLTVLFMIIVSPVASFAKDVANEYGSIESFELLDDEEGFLCGYNNETGYYTVVEDMADLLSYGEEINLLYEMTELSYYGNAAIVTIDYNEYSTAEDYARCYSEYDFGDSSNTVFLIDMENRKIWIYSYGYIMDIVSSSDNDVITDNIYKYASREEYYKCCSMEVEQITALLRGDTIAQPMKYISNACLAIVISLVINYILMLLMSTDSKASNNERLMSIKNSFVLKNKNMIFLNRTRVYNPESSSSSGGSSGGGGGGSSGGHGF